MRILLTVCYDGTDFFGYQVQPGKRTVESVLNSAIEKVIKEPVKSVASGRTDSGVHALCQKVHFDTVATIPPEKFKNAINTFLPPDVKVISSQLVSDDFNARYSAKQKTYRYSCYFGEFEHPLKNRYKTLISGELNYDTINACIDKLVGVHDFKCFCASGSSVKDTVRQIYSIKVDNRGNELDFYVTGSGFLYNMVRIIVGTLLKAGEGKLTPNDVENALLGSARIEGVKTMKANGLCLYSVNY